jgi:hypothetical protein
MPKKFFKGSDYSDYDPEDYIKKNKSTGKKSKSELEDFSEDSDVLYNFFVILIPYLAIGLAIIIIPLCLFAIFWNNSLSIEHTIYPILFIISILISGAIIWYSIKDYIAGVMMLVLVFGGQALLISIVVIFIPELISGTGCSWIKEWVGGC